MDTPLAPPAPATAPPPTDAAAAPASILGDRAWREAVLATGVPDCAPVTVPDRFDALLDLLRTQMKASRKLRQAMDRYSAGEESEAMTMLAVRW